MSVSPADKRRIARWVHTWRNRMLLSSWSVGVVFHSESDPDDPDTHAEFTGNHRYSEMTLHIYPPFWDSDKGQQQRYLMHELAHTLTDHVWKLLHRKIDRKRVTMNEAEDALFENLTEHIANVLWVAYEERR